MEDKFAKALRQTADLMNRELSTFLPDHESPEHQLHEAMRYATLSGGKRLRAFLVIQCADLFDVSRDYSVRVAAALEILHTYSLIHDDLPCMDDDDLRRGQPTLHCKWDEATAVLAGDSLQTLAFELLAREEVGLHAIRLIRTMAEAAGKDGMVSGQMLDIAAETAEAPLTLEQITTLQARKTGCLIEWSACAGARLAGADPAPLRHYAQALGLAFQIADDILDIEGDAATVGKAVRKDEDAGKATFVSLLGLEGAKRRAQELADQACAALVPYGAAGDTLKDAARFVISRDS